MYILILITFLHGNVVDVEAVSDEIRGFGRCHQIGLATGATTEAPDSDGLQYVCQPRKDLVK